MKTIIITMIAAMVYLNLNALTTYTVIKNTDPDPYKYPYDFNDAKCDPVMYGTLQWAIRKSLDTPDECLIVFDIPGKGPFTIFLNYGLPSIDKRSILIDATTQPGFTVDNPQIILNGNYKQYTGLHFNNVKNNCGVKGIYFKNFISQALLFNYTENFEIANNYFTENGSTGSKVNPASIRIVNSTNGNIKGNYIGIDESGNTIGNNAYGMVLSDNSNSNTIGGIGSGEANTIVKNMKFGIWITKASKFNKISGNVIYDQDYAISLNPDGNGQKSPPYILSYDPATGLIKGKSEKYDNIEIFGSKKKENANEYLGTATTGVYGEWTINNVYTNFNYFTATATDASSNTSPLSDTLKAFQGCVIAAQTAYQLDSVSPSTFLSVCTKYKIDYLISRNPDSAFTSSNITINLPYGIAFDSLLNADTIVTSTSLPGTPNPVFTVNWTNDSALISIIVETPQCAPDSTVPTTIIDSNCSSIFSVAVPLLPLVSPSLFVQNTATAPLQVNTGDAEELVFKIQNNSTELLDIPLINVLLSPDQTIQLLGNYYFTNSPNLIPQHTYNKYTYPVNPSAISFTGNNISIGQPDFNNIFGSGVNALQKDSLFYLHIPYTANSCAQAGGSYIYTWSCASACHIDTITSEINIVAGGAPVMLVTGYPHENGTYCSSGSAKTTVEMGFEYKNTGNAVTGNGVPAGNAKATDLQLYIFNDTTAGAVNDTFKISFGSDTINIHGIWQPVLSTYGYKVYLIDFSTLAVGSNLNGSPLLWNPVGSGNTLSDIDGDGFVDDIAENGTFTITAKYTYNTQCPFNPSQCYNNKNILNIRSRYNNQCFTLDSNDYSLYTFNAGNSADGYYGYSTRGYPVQIPLPPDVLEANPLFFVNINPGDYYETWFPHNFNFDCPDGYHRLKLTLPAGYHLNIDTITNGFTYIGAGTPGTSSGIFQMPQIKVWCRQACDQFAIPDTLNPVIQEFCPQGSNLGYVIINFGKRIKTCSCYFSETYQLNDQNGNPVAINVPLKFECSGTNSVCGGTQAVDPYGNTADVFKSQMQFVCDTLCSSCTTSIICSSGATFHHCLGECDSYFSTNANSFTFLRQNIGYENANLLYYPCDPLFNPNLAVPPSGSLSLAYPGDIIKVNVKGGFIGTPDTNMTAHTGSDYQNIYLQIRYDDLPAGIAADYVLFDLDTTQGKIRITNSSDTTGYTFIEILSSSVTLSSFVDLGIVHLNFNISQAGRNFINDSTILFTFDAELFLIARTHLNNSTAPFYIQGKHPLTGLRAEFMGTRTMPLIEDHSCDSWGTNFAMLQPFSSVGISPTGNITCDIINVRFYLEAQKAGFSSDDFPYEFRAYSALDPQDTIIIPPGYKYLSSTFYILHSTFDSITGINGFNPAETQTYPLAFPITPVYYTNNPNIADTLIFNGINSSGINCWPLLDLKRNIYSNPWYILYVNLQPLCYAEDSADIKFSGGYTDNISSPYSQYKVHRNFNIISHVNHINPLLYVVPPPTSIDAFDNKVTFNFKVCNQPGAVANSSWAAIENSLSNSLNLSSAIVQDLSTGDTLQTNVYTDNNNNYALLVNTGTILTSVCKTYSLTATINNPDGCVNGNNSVSDSINVYVGNECSIPFDSLTSPDQLCRIDTTYKFNFKRYPSKLELLTDVNGIPSDTVDLCAGSLTYNFILKSLLEGTITNPAFWIDLPTGISVNNITFNYLSDSYSTAISDTGTLDNPGWNIYSHFSDLANNGLTGTQTSPNNQILIAVTLNTHCGYNVNDSIKFYAGGVSSCSEKLTTDTIKHRPDINNAKPADNLSVVTAMTTNDNSPFINCTNKGVITITVINNDTTANIHDNVLTVNVPAPPLNLSYISQGGTYDSTAGTLSWTIPSGSLNSEDSLVFLYSLTMNGFTCDSFLITPAISYTDTVICSDSSNCSVTYSYASEPATITACCSCQASVTSQTGVSCNGGSNGTATVTGTTGIPPYSYQWNDGQTTATAVNLSTGNYNVTVTDSTGCFSIAYVTITNDFLPPPIASISILNTDTNCIKVGNTVLFSAPAQAGVTYNWDFGDSTTSTTQNPSHIFNDFGFYQVNLTVTNICDTASDCISLFVNPADYDCYTVYDIPNDTILSGNITWSSGTIKVKGDVYIPNGATLNISNATVQFAPRSRLIVGIGGRLVINNNSVLDGIDNCMWQGVEVWGVTGQPSTNSLQGKITINNSTITNAYIGVLLGKRAKYGVCHLFTVLKGGWDTQKSGGVIRAQNSYFTGNGVDIRFTSKSNNDGTANLIDGCYFTCPVVLKDIHYSDTATNRYPSVHNHWAGYANPNRRTNIGIISVNLRRLSIINSTFRNLEYGIYTFDNKQTTVRNCDFRFHRLGMRIENTVTTIISSYDISDCTFDSIPGNTQNVISTNEDGTAIYSSGSYGDRIHDGNFFRNTYSINFTTYYPYGIKTNNASGFDITNNFFNDLTNGITIQNSGANGGYVRAKASSTIYSWQGNIFNQCKTGITTKNNNLKLCLRCNDHNNGTGYIVNWENTIGGALADQGFANSNSISNMTIRSRYAAGNFFAPGFAKDINSPVLSPYNYYHHISPPSYIPVVGSSPITLSPVNASFISKTQSCLIPNIPPNINLPGSLNDPVFLRIDSLNNVVLALESQYLTLLNNADKGHTIELLSAINAEPPTGQLKNMLLDNSPLSDTVLVTLNNQNPLSNGNYKNVMEENLPVTRNVVPAFNSRVETMPPGIKNQLKDKQAYNPGKITLGYLETMLGQAKLTKQLYFNEIISLLTDTVNNRTADAIILFEREGTPVANMLLAATYLSDSNYSSAASKIALLPDDGSQYLLWKAYSTFLLNHYAQGKTLEDLDSLQIEYIRMFAYRCPEEMATVNAKAILMYLFREEVPACPENGTRSMRVENNKIKLTKKSYLGENYPDPFTRNTIIPYYLPKGAKGELIIKDVTGRIILTLSLHEGENTLEIDSKDWAKGIYFYGMKINDENIENKKMIKTE